MSLILGMSYAEWIGYTLTIILVILFGLPSGWLKRLEKYYSSDHLHQPLSPDQVSVIILWKDGKERLMNEAERQDAIKWYNSAKLVQKVETFEASESSCLYITCKDGRVIKINSYRNDILIQRPDGGKNNKPVAYWAKQDEITTWLRKDERNVL
jgi:hypothetical protein